ncbi:MAG TPA: hypothetical protein VME22_14645 [Solirubrobacteraceae bacterium]|nr:hypothetical protein [Solirubrobacteraceae bacterium]
MIVVILANVVLSALVVIAIVGSLAHAIVPITPLRLHRRVMRAATSRLSASAAPQQSITRA